MPDWSCAAYFTSLSYCGVPNERGTLNEHTLADKPHASVWLAKTYVVPAGSLGVKLTTTIWAVSRECGH
eukprot:158038-Pelagomonas_calceolata.AAC.1